jgi:hypothetical protein
MVAPTESTSSVIAFRRHTHLPCPFSWIWEGYDVRHCGQATPWCARWCSQERAAGRRLRPCGRGWCRGARSRGIPRISVGAPREGGVVAQIWGFGRTAAVLPPRCSSNPHFSSPPASDGGSGHGVRARQDLRGVCWRRSIGSASGTHQDFQEHRERSKVRSISPAIRALLCDDGLHVLLC